MHVVVQAFAISIVVYIETEEKCDQKKAQPWTWMEAPECFCRSAPNTHDKHMSIIAIEEKKITID